MSRKLPPGWTLTGAVTEGNGSKIMGEGFEMLRLDVDHGVPGERNVILDVGLAHGLVHQGINFFHLGRGKRRDAGCPSGDGCALLEGSADSKIPPNPLLPKILTLAAS